MDSDPINSFKTHKNYIAAYHAIIDQRTGFRSREPLFQHLYGRIRNTDLLSGTTETEIDEETLKKSLCNAWGTEFLLYANRSVARDDEVVRLSNNWSVIQAYYVFYHSTQALIISKGMLRPESHPKTQKSYKSLWCDRSSTLHPWSLCYSSSGLTNSPSEYQIDDLIHAWTYPDQDSSWSLIAKSLKTTRKDFLTDAIKAERVRKKKLARKNWDAEESSRLSQGKRARKPPADRLPRLSSDEKTAISSKLRSYTMMDYLYRLRIKTNYVDANMFTDGPEDETSSSQIRRQVCEIASATLFVTELQIMNQWNKAKFIEFLKDWAQKNIPPTFTLGLPQRISILEQHES